MKKIWHEQDQRTLYAIDGDALLKRVLNKKKGSKRLSGINEIGLIVINLVVILVFTFKALGPLGSVYKLLIPLFLVGSIAYIWYLRSRRKKSENQYGRTLLGELDHAIASRKYLENMSRTMVWWYLLPMTVPVLVGLMIQGPFEILQWKYLLMLGAFGLSFVLTRLEFKRVHLPKRRELEQLREMLLKSEQ